MLEQISLDYFSLGIGALAGLIFGALVVSLIAMRIAAEKNRIEKDKIALEARMEAERASMDDHFAALAGKVLESNSANFLNMAQEKLKAAQAAGAHDLDKRSIAIEQMVKPVHEHLQKLGGAVEQLHGTKKAIQDDLRSLSKETSKLVGVLRNPAAQGKWGEFVLERLLDKANLQKGVHYETQVQTAEGKRPDVVIHLQDGFHIVVDAKAPINDFVERMDDDLSDSEYADLKVNLARQVRAHVRALGAKAYQESLDSPDFVVLFLPSEQMFSYAIQADPQLIDFASENQVVIASPTLMMSLLRVVGLSWRQVELAKNAQDIARQGGSLYDKMVGFVEDLQLIGKRLDGADAAYRAAMNKLSEGRGNILSKTEGLKMLGAQTSKSMPADLIDTEEAKSLIENATDKKIANG